MQKSACIAEISTKVTGGYFLCSPVNSIVLASDLKFGRRWVSHWRLPVHLLDFRDAASFRNQSALKSRIDTEFCTFSPL